MIYFPRPHAINGGFGPLGPNVYEEYFYAPSSEGDAVIIHLAYHNYHNGKARLDRAKLIKEVFTKTTELCFMSGIIAPFAKGAWELDEILTRVSTDKEFGNCFELALGALGVIEFSRVGELPLIDANNAIDDAGPEFFAFAHQFAQKTYESFLGREIAITDSLVWRPGDDDSGIGCEMRHFDPPIQAIIMETESQHIGVWANDDVMVSYYEIKITNRENQLSLGETIRYISGPEWKPGQGWTAPDPNFTKWEPKEASNAH